MLGFGTKKNKNKGTSWIIREEQISTAADMPISVVCRQESGDCVVIIYARGTCCSDQLLCRSVCSVHTACL